jgi:hypothetical protein
MERLPYFIELPDALVVHAFFEPGVAAKDQKRSVLAGMDSGEEYLARRYGWPWYKHYDGKKPIIVGHRDYESSGHPMIWKDRVFAIDTRCCEGLALTGLVLPEFRLVTVPARRNHWAELKALYKDIRESSREAAESAGKMTWHKLEHALALSQSGSLLPVEKDRNLRKLSETLSEGERRLARLRDYLMRVGSSATGDIEDLPEFRRLSAGKRRTLLAETDPGHLAPLIERARKGTLTIESLKERFRRPRDVYEIVSMLGLGE